jgi:tetratricopeptide (TPR) repeat protein
MGKKRLRHNKYAGINTVFYSLESSGDFLNFLNMLKKIILVFLIFPVFLLSQDDTQNRFMLANSYEQAGEYEKAKSILEDIYSRKPENFQFFDALNRVYLQLKDYEASEKLLLKKLAANPQDVNLYGLLGKTYHLKGDEKKAFDTWDSALEKSNYNLSVYRLIANYAIDRRAFSKAIEVLEEGKKKSDKPEIFSLELANLYTLTMNYQKAAGEFLDLLLKKPQDLYNVRTRISKYINKPEALSATIAVFESNKNRSPEAKTITAWLYTENRNYKEAYKLYSELDAAQGSRGGDIYNFAQLLFSKKEYEAAAEVYNEIADKYSDSPFKNAAKLGYARSLEEMYMASQSRRNWKPMVKSTAVSSPEIDKLLETYLDIRENIGNSDLLNEAAYRAARIYFYNKNEIKKAEDILREIVEDYPTSQYAPQAALELGNIYIRQGSLDNAEIYLKKAAGMTRSAEEHKNKAKLMMAEIAFYKKNIETAQNLLAQVTSNLKDNSTNDAIEFSLLLNTKMNDSLSLLSFAEAEFLARQEKFDKAGELYDSLSNAKSGFLLSNMAKLRSAEVKLATDQIDASVVILEKISEDEGRNIYSDKALYLLGNIYEYSLDDPRKALGIYEKLLARFPSSMYLDEAREHIVELKEKIS